MASYNRVILVGNLTRDPELRYIPSGTPVVDLGLAVNHRRKAPSGEWVEEPVFVDITLWERQAEVASEYLSKGSPVLIEGRLKLDTWTTNDGQKRSKLRVVGERMQLLGARQPGEGAPGGQAAPPRQRPQAQDQQYEPAYSEPDPGPQYEDVPAAEPPTQDDIPF